MNDPAPTAGSPSTGTDPRPGTNPSAGRVPTWGPGRPPGSRGRPVRRPVGIVLLCGLVCGLAGACGGGGSGGGGAGRGATPTTSAGSGGGAATSTPPPTVPGGGRRLTLPQALQLAQVLYLDYELGGARVAVDVPYARGVDVALTGLVDFRHHEGHLTVVTSEDGHSETQRVDYTATAVYEQVAATPGRAAAASGTAAAWTVRAPDPVHRPIDKVIAILVALASPQRDNPLLVQQSNAAFEGTERLDGVALNRYRYSGAITYLVGAGDGLLHQFQGVVQGFSGTVTVNLSQWRSTSVPPPPPSAVVRSSSPTTG